MAEYSFKVEVNGGNNKLCVYVDGKKFNPKNDVLSGGEHIIAVKNELYLSKWYAFILILFDFIKSVFSGLFRKDFLRSREHTVFL